VTRRICVCVNADAVDEHAVEVALSVRDVTGWEVVVVSMAPATARAGMRRALAMGADRATLVADRVLELSDLIPTSRLLAAVVAREAPELVIFGAGSPDASLLCSAVSERLGWPLLSHAASITIVGQGVRASRGGTVVEAECPVVVGLVGPVGTPRQPDLSAIASARRKAIAVVTAGSLGLIPEDGGLVGSRTRVLGVDPWEAPSKQTTLIDGPDAADQLFAILKEWGAVFG
jgi:electron transfer flavoprotein beta subunit